jgi:1-acyl-sn-glycerol-3-phosphate acyltransferase
MTDSTPSPGSTPRQPSLAAPLAFAGRPRPWATRLLERLGWRYELPAPPESRVLLVVYPHTSNWDFLWGILTRWGSGWPIRWLGKHTLFFGPAGWLLRRWGGIPVNRGEAEGFAERIADDIRNAPSMLLTITPEGTRSYRDHWKSGFYRIARAADVPIGIAFIDYATRTVGIREYFRLSGDEAADLDRIAAAYAEFAGKDPAKAAPIRFKRAS